MSGEFQTVSTGVAAHIGKYADAVRIPAGAEVIYTSGTPGLRPDGTVPEDFTEQATRRGATSRTHSGARVPVRPSVIKHEPAFMFAVIPALMRPNIRVEVEVIAIRPGT